MLDPWHFALALLTCSLPTTPIRWPTERTLRHECAYADDDEGAAGHTLTACEADTLHHLKRQPRRAGELAVTLGIAPGTMHVRLHRIRERGLIVGGRDGWRSAAVETQAIT